MVGLVKNCGLNRCYLFMFIFVVDLQVDHEGSGLIRSLHSWSKSVASPFNNLRYSIRSEFLGNTLNGNYKYLNLGIMVSRCVLRNMAFKYNARDLNRVKY